MDDILFVKDCDNKQYDCGNCKYFYTNGMTAPGGFCSLHPEFNKWVCMDYKNFPNDATICNDIKLRSEYA